MYILLIIMLIVGSGDNNCLVLSKSVRNNFVNNNNVNKNKLEDKQAIFTPFINTKIDPSVTASLIDKTKKMSGTNEQKAEFFSTSLIELISNSNNKNPSDIIAAGTSTLSDMNLDGIVGEGANPEEGLAEETPQCFNQMKKTFGGLFKCLSGLAMGECCEGESGGWKNGIESHANGIIQNAVTHVRSWLQ